LDSKNPIVVEHFDSLGILGDRSVRASALQGMTIALVSLGADKVLIPTPGDQERKRVEYGFQLLPKERRRLVKTVDEKGHILGQVREYLRPLKEQVTKWPETAFVGFVEDSLYDLAVACKFKAMVCNESLLTCHEFLPIIDPSAFRGEARYRLSELKFLLTRYEPMLMKRLAITGSVSEEGVRESLSRILESSLFDKIVASEGRLGYLNHPNVGLLRVKRAVSDLIARKNFRTVVKTAAVVSELAPVPIKPGPIEDLLPRSKNERSFSPPFIDLPLSVNASIARAALAEAFPGAVSVKETIFVEEYMRGGAVSYSWLNEGEEEKLIDDPRKQLAHQTNAAEKARRSMM
jgi:hypothetical protein